MARLDGIVTGVDASPENIGMATLHSKRDPFLHSSERLRYISSTAEQLLESGGENQFDVVCGLEIIEHVRNPEDFIGTCIKLIKVWNGVCSLFVFFCFFFFCYIFLFLIFRWVFFHIYIVAFWVGLFLDYQPDNHFLFIYHSFG